MKVGILGTGVVGHALGVGFVTLGHQVMMGSRAAGHEKAAAWARTHGASEGSFSDAAAFGDLIVVATKGTVLPEVVAAAGAGNFAGKVVIDTTNPLDHSKGFPPGLAIKGDDSGGETLQRVIPDGKVVKAFNIVSSSLMFRPEVEGGPPDMYIAGNDAEAKAAVSHLLADFGWPRVVDFGGIGSSRWLEALCIVWVYACANTGNWRQAFRLLPAKA